MERLPVILARSYQPISLGIQVKTACKWSHVATPMPNGHEVIEARGGFGVVRTSLPDFHARYRETMIVTVPCVSRELAYQILESKVGLEYDMKAFAGLMFALKLNNPMAYQCAELVGLAMAWLDHRYLPELTPKHMLFMSKPIEV